MDFGKIITCLCLSSFLPGLTADVCDTATLLPSLTKRNNGYVLQAGDSPLCDYYLEEKWYSIGTYIIATTNEGCGTTYPWYMKDPLPEEGETAVTVCKDNKAGNTCFNEKLIQVKRCIDGNYVFRLVPPDGCAEAYCIENLKPKNETQDTEPPELSISPVISVKVLRLQPDDQNELFFYCEFTPATGTDYYYTVEWYQSSGLALTSHIWTANPTKYSDSFKEQTALRETVLRQNGFRLGIRIVCVVAASHELVSETGPSRASKDKFIGIEVVNKTAVRIQNNQEDVIFVRLTLPFGCPKEEPNCYLDMNVLMPEDDYKCKSSEVALKDVFKRNPCGVRFHNEDVDTLQPLKLQAMFSKDLPAQSRKLTARFQTHTHVESHPFFANYQIDSIQVRDKTSL